MANAGSDLLAIAGESVSFDGSKSRDNNYVETYLWDFGDGATASSATTSHTYANEGKYTATLTVTDSSGNTASDTVSVTVLGSDNDRFIVKTTDENGVKLPDVNIICDEIFGDGESRSTDSNGEYIIIAPEGEYTLYLYADGYLPIKQTVKSTGTTTISLTKKDVAEGKLTVRELDYNEIVALGINLEAPENRQVFEYNVEVEHLEGSNCFKSRQFRNAEGALITDNSESGFRDEYNLNGIKLWEYDNNELIYSRSNGSSSGGFGNGGLKDLKLVAAMSITTDLTWLKEFYSVDLTIWNNASEDFFIDNALARITLPEGLSLADTDGLSKEIGKIEGGETKVISWIVRGDKSGSYNIAANFTGSLEPIGVPIEIDFETENPLVVEAGNALKLEVVHDLWSPSNDVWTIDYKLTNVSEKPVYDIQFEIITQYAIKCGMSIKEIDIYYIDREGYDNIHWTDGKPDFERTERFFDPLIENIPDKTISLYPGEYLEFTVYVTKE
jgi:PKD repeat protein